MGVVKDDRQDGDGTKAFDVWPESAIIGCSTGFVFGVLGVGRADSRRVVI
jgi:hypothetical protein